jgi:lipid A ethanolaminephosphotransferase
MLAAFAWQHRLPIYAERDAPYFAPDGAPLADHIILVVDESISGHWLGVNGAAVDTTPWLSSAPAGVFNYGIASAISNLSSSSNILLQTGLRPSDVPDRTLRALRGPNLFSYAEQAGFHTALIDAQTYSDAPPNLMTGFDLRRIATVVRLREAEVALPEHAVDFAALPLISDIVEGHRRSFIYLIKTGAHLPYGDKSPADERSFSTVASTQVTRVRHEYWDAIRWSADHFLQQLAARLESSERNVLVVYTSDHGQFLADETSQDRLISPHATLNAPPSEQASVPLLLLGFGEPVRAALSARFQRELVDHASAFQIFPTLLQAAGYSAENSRAYYAPSLFEGVLETPRIFVTGNIIARNAGAYVLNREIGDGCFVNPFDVEAVRPPNP